MTILSGHCNSFSNAYPVIVIYVVEKHRSYFVTLFIAQNAYCSWDIYFQFKSVVDLSYSRVIMHRRLERASIIGCQERTTTLINLMKATN